MSRIRSLAPLVALAATAAVAAPAPARAETLAAATDADVSSNWAGYAATGADFSKVSGTWTQPAASCSSGEGDAAFWVGLGGASESSQALEQVGTEADCTGGSATYEAWYELVPAAPVKLGLKVRPGDTISASVRVSGTRVTIWLMDRTTGRSVLKTLAMRDPDTSSAEWIAEAPSVCSGGASGACETIPLADFDAVTFKDATATADGLTGPIGDAHWTATAMQLQPGAGAGFGGGRSGGGFGRRGAVGGTTTASAIPSVLSTSGRGFTVAWQSEDDEADAGPGGWGGGGGGGWRYGVTRDQSSSNAMLS